MDDLVLWDDEKSGLLRRRDAILDFARDELGLELKPPILNRTAGGMDLIPPSSGSAVSIRKVRCASRKAVLGFRFQPGWIGLSRRSWRRLRRRIRGYERAWAEGWLTEQELQDRATAAMAFVEPAKTARMRRQLVEESLYDGGGA